MDYLTIIKKMVDHDHSVANDDAYYCLPAETLNPALDLLRAAGVSCRYLEEEKEPLKPAEVKPTKPEAFEDLSVNDIMSKVGKKL